VSQQYAAAAREYRRAIEIQPRSHIAHYNLSQIYLLLGDRVQAAKEARVAFALNPTPLYQDLVTRISRMP
jgi:tetratricopeptide (TPR) repeat protein